MAELKYVRVIGDPVLRKKARPVKFPVSKRVQALVEEMYQVMDLEEGIGLAAPQVGESIRMIVVDTRKDTRRSDGVKMAMINPKITAQSSETEPYNEGCLSIPGINVDVVRPVRITVEWQTLQGAKKQIAADGILARVLQHEIDHLDGILFVDHLSEEERQELDSELKELARSAGKGRTVTL